MKHHVLKISLILAIISSLSSSCTSPEQLPSDVATVVRVIDGDTVVLRLQGAIETVRLIGVDTPETVHPTKPIECFGPEASAFTHSVLKPKTQVRVQRDVEARDRYQRLLVYIYLTDGTFINQELLRLGFARTLNIAPNTAFTTIFASIETEAREKQIGLWLKC